MILRYKNNEEEVVIDTDTNMINGQQFTKIRDDLYRNRRNDAQVSYILYGNKLVREIKRMDNLLIQISVDDFRIIS